MKRRDVVRAGVGAGIAGLLLWLPRRHRGRTGETTEVRFVRQVGLGYLQLHVMRALQLVEKHARALGHPGLAARFTTLASPTAMNDLVLSGGVDVVAAGTPPFLTIWDKTRGSLDVRALAGLACQPGYLLTNADRIRRVEDLSDRDRIAVPSVRVSAQATFLQMFAERIYGRGQERRFDPLTVGVSHPEAAAALMHGHSEIDVHFSSFPLQAHELRHPGVRRIAMSYDATEGPATSTLVYCTSRFVAENPITVAAVMAALDEATKLIATQPDEATAIYHAIEDQNLPRELVAACVKDPRIVWSLTPQRALYITSFMARTGRLARPPAHVGELFFPSPQVAEGS